MQEVRVKEVKSKTGVTAAGKNAGKPWELVIIIGEDGSEYTTFDIGAKEVGTGGVIELEPVIKNGKVNFTKFNIKQKGAASGGQGNGNGRDGHSIETQVAFKGIVELMVAKIIEPTDELSKMALDWASKHFTATLQETLAAAPHLPEPTGSFKDRGEFFTAMHEKGLSRQQTIDELIRLKLIKAEADLPKLDLDIAWEALGTIPEDIPF